MGVSDEKVLVVRVRWCVCVGLCDLVSLDHVHVETRAPRAVLIGWCRSGTAGARTAHRPCLSFYDRWDVGGGSREGLLGTDSIVTGVQLRSVISVYQGGRGTHTRTLVTSWWAAGLVGWRPLGQRPKGEGRNAKGWCCVAGAKCRLRCFPGPVLRRETAAIDRAAAGPCPPSPCLRKPSRLSRRRRQWARTSMKPSRTR